MNAFPARLCRLKTPTRCAPWLAAALLAGCSHRPAVPPPPPMLPVGMVSTSPALPGGARIEEPLAPSAAAAASAPASPVAPTPPTGGMLVVTDPATLLPVWNDELRALSPDALQREITRLSQVLNLTSTPAAEATAMSMRLALALTQGRGPGTDWPRAQVLFEQVARNAQPDCQAWRPWARLLAVRVQELRRLDEQLDRQAQQLRDQQRRIEVLGDKLEALKAIERNLPARPRAPVAPSAATPSAKPSERRP